MQVGQLYNVYRKNGEDIVIYRDMHSTSERIPNSAVVIYMNTNIYELYTVYIQGYGMRLLYGDYTFQKVK